MTRTAIPALLVAVGVFACGADDRSTGSNATGPAHAHASEGAAAIIKTFMFKPEPVRVKAGTSVTWTNQDDILHTVTAGKRGSPSGEFDKKLNLSDQFDYTFERPGAYPYVCTIHKGMDGTVIVS